MVLVSAVGAVVHTYTRFNAYCQTPRRNAALDDAVSHYALLDTSRFLILMAIPRLHK